jgi:hypothetical protein
MRLKHVEMAYNFSMIRNYEERRKLLVDYLNSRRLKSVQIRMKSHVETVTKGDQFIVPVVGGRSWAPFLTKRSVEQSDHIFNFIVVF